MINNKVKILITSVLMSTFLFACGKSPSITTSDLGQTKLVSLMVDPCPPGCDCRPKTKVQAITEDDSDPTVDTTKTTQATTPVVTKISTKTTTPATKTATDDLISGDALPEVKAPATTTPPANSGTVTPPVKEKTKVGQFIDKIKNIFKKKS